MQDNTPKTIPGLHFRADFLESGGGTHNEQGGLGKVSSRSFHISHPSASTLSLRPRKQGWKFVRRRVLYFRPTTTAVRTTHVYLVSGIYMPMRGLPYALAVQRKNAS